MNLMQLLSVNETNNAANYLPIDLQLLFAGGFVAFMILVSSLLGPKRKTDDKLATFTSGILTHGDARSPMAIKYFLIAIWFVLFDVEVIFLYPWAINFKELGIEGMIKMVIFMLLLLVGFFYIIKKKALEWE
jgi:NADH-quinone oxidoreductase subunit A